MAGIFGWNLQTFVEISVLFLVLVSEMDAFQFASGGMNFPLRMLPKTQTQAKISSESGVTMQFQVDGLGKMSVWRDHLLAMATYGAILGPQLDGYHSAFGVLKYAHPKPISFAGNFLFETDYWVPAMFALAAVILGITYPLLDNFFKEDKLSIPSPPKSLACVSFFCFQYYCSGLLFQQDVEDVYLHLTLASTALACWTIFDRTRTGVVMSMVTGLCGPLVEIFLLEGWPALTGQTLYAYTAPDVHGIPLWIGWVYACGAPAVGGLSRITWEYMSSRKLRGTGHKD